MSAELEEQIAQLENSLGQEQQRLEKLWDAYEQQEKDLNASLDRINRGPRAQASQRNSGRSSSDNLIPYAVVEAETDVIIQW